MFDDDIDEPAAAEPNEWHIPDLPLDFKGEKGNVQFRSLEDLSGAHLDRLRSQMGAAKNDGEVANTYYLEAAKILITSWDIPGKPNLAIPKGDPKAWGQIPLVIRRQIERHVRPRLDGLMGEKDNDSTDPFAPGGPSRPASA